MSKYETLAGHISRADTFTKLLDLLRQAEDQCYVLSNIHADAGTSKDTLMATGWRAIGQMLHMTQARVTQLAQGRLQ